MVSTSKLKSLTRQTFKQITVVLGAKCDTGMVIRDIKDAGLNLGHGKITVKSWCFEPSK